MKRKKRSKKTDARVVVRMSIGLILITLGFILALGAAGLAGVAGGSAFHFTFSSIGVEAFLLPLVIAVIGLTVLTKKIPLTTRTAIGLLVILVAVLIFLGAVAPYLGGSLGADAGIKLTQFFGFAGSLAVLLATALIGLALVTDIVALFNILQSGTKQASKSHGRVCGSSCRKF
jgi:uncharacterized membrane protein YidH (DUF202 family)